MLSEVSQIEKDKYYIISLICGISKKMETKPQICRYREQTSVAEGRGNGVVVWCGSKAQSSSYKTNSHGGVVTSRATVVNHTGLHTWKRLRETMSEALITGTHSVTMYGGRRQLDLLWGSLCTVHKYQSIGLDTWKQYTIVCQLYLNC